MSATDRLLLYGRVCIDAVAYAVLFAGVLTLIAVTLGIATGGGFVRGKLLLFAFGWLGLAYATVKLWPRSSEEMDQSSGGRSIGEPTASTRLQRFVYWLPPMRWIGPPPATRQITPEGKLFFGSIFALIVSYLMEQWFGIV